MDVACKYIEYRPETAWQPSCGEQPMYDGPDLPSTDIPEDLTGPEPQSVPLDVSLLHRIYGYETVGYYVDADSAPFITPPRASELIPSENYATTEEVVSRTFHASDDQVRRALLDLVSERCCYGKSAAKNMAISKIVTSSAFHYTLETYVETRSTAWDQEPYTGQPVDSPLNGRAPLPWDIHCFPTQMFHDEIHIVEVPHTAAVMPCLGCRCLGWLRCYNCLGRGFKRCISCHGSGRLWKADAHGHRHVDSCWRCHGTGRKRCPSCGGDGRVVCRTCHGYKHLKCFIKLRIEYRNNFCEDVVEHTKMPSHLIKTVTGENVFEQTQPRVWPILNHPEREVSKASQALVNEHLREFHYARIIMQRQRLRMVPVFECHYAWNGSDGCFWVYGKEMTVHAPDYPQKCCCGCNLM